MNKSLKIKKLVAKRDILENKRKLSNIMDIFECSFQYNPLNLRILFAQKFDRNIYESILLSCFDYRFNIRILKLLQKKQYFDISSYMAPSNQTFSKTI